MPDVHRGSCLCGAVAFEVTEPMRDVVACHCRQCRKTSGHFWAASSVPLDRFRLTKTRGLAWYRSSARAQRGFCNECGASLFWTPEGEGRMSFAPAALDGATGLSVAAHIFTADAGDYYSPEGPPPAASSVSGPLRASCLCGSVRFALPGPAGAVVACHCRQCRKLSGHYSASFDVDEALLRFEARATLAEYATSGGGRRGFCSGCGSSLYFRACDGAFSVELGCIDSATGSRLVEHIFVADKGDYYQIDDGLPQAAQSD